MRALLLLLAACAGAPELPCDARFDADRDGHDDCADCDDADPAVFPGAVELCNGVDDDCDGVVDDSPADATPELCNGVDDDCDGQIDEEAGDAPWRLDLDGDGFGDDGAAAVCEDDGARSLVGGDCDDAAAEVFPGAPETWDGRDEDCDGRVDDLRLDRVALHLLHGEAGHRLGGRERVAWGGDLLDDGAQDLVALASVGGDLSTAWVVSGHELPDRPQPISAVAGSRLTRAACGVNAFCLDPRDLLRTAGPARDVTGDGVDDLVIVAERLINGQTVGEVLVLAGGQLPFDADLVPTTVVHPFATTANLLVDPGAHRVALGDWDGDGADDLVVARASDEPVPPFPVTQPQHGGLSLTAAGLCRQDACPGSALGYGDDRLRLWGAPGQQLGHQVLLVDLDGDGDDELLVGAPYLEGAGAVLVVQGGVDVLGLAWSPASGPGRTWGQLRGAAGERLGSSERTLAAGVPDGDGALVVVGSPVDPVVHLWRLGSGEPGVVRADALPLTLRGEEGSAPGTTACVAPGWVLVGDPGAPGEQGQAAAGAVYAFRSARLRGEAALHLDEADAVLRGAEAGDAVGSALACGVDVDGDGQPDAVVGASGWDADGSSGDHGLVAVVRLPP
ncbi:MAG: putative metal-binding motif-containing protein [Alphaproteobacteria bacterium]|nr:putative metal-binding motif-containing protein [Alphaproteobacteria bacterium]